jgi:hypothetical protein
MRLLLTILVCLLPLCAQQEGQQKKKGGPPPGPPTNLKVLKVTSGVEVRQIMRTFTAGLGVQCNYCHVQGNFAADDNPKKETARHMIQMTDLLHLSSRRRGTQNRARAETGILRLLTWNRCSSTVSGSCRSKAAGLARSNG